MKAYIVDGDGVVHGIPVVMEPYPHLVLGQGGHKRATWIALGKRDADTIVKDRMKPCPKQGTSDSTTDPATCSPEHICEQCGQVYGPWEEPNTWNFYYRYHPKAGAVVDVKAVLDVGVLALKGQDGQPNGKYLLVAPRGADNRVLVHWRVPSGYRGSASITAGEDVVVIARDSSWHSGQGATGETAEMLAVLKPGQELRASRSGRRVQNTKARLVWNGKEIKVTFGGDEMNAAQSDDVEGDYV